MIESRSACRRPDDMAPGVSFVTQADGSIPGPIGWSSIDSTWSETGAPLEIFTWDRQNNAIEPGWRSEPNRLRLSNVDGRSTVCCLQIVGSRVVR